MASPRVRHRMGPVIGYHGCDRAVGEKILKGEFDLKPSNNDYDWLGPGIYFWVDSPERAVNWALEQKKRGRIKRPFVIGAYIHFGLCLNLTDFGVLDELRDTYNYLKKWSDLTSKSLPKNDFKKNGVHLKRPLDAKVISTLHYLREQKNEPAYDSVYGVFEEGDPLFPGSAMKAMTHVQVAVRNVETCIVGYFRLPALGQVQL